MPSVHALRVCQRYGSRDARDLRRVLPAACNQTALSDSSRGAGEGLAEAHGAHTCETRSEVVILLCGSIPSTQGHAYRPFAEHAGGGRRSVQSKRALPRTMSDFIVRTFGATQVAPVRIQHNTTYRRKNGTFTSERTLTRGSSASDRHAEDAPWISSPFIRSVTATSTPTWPRGQGGGRWLCGC